jgi:hypothetical protein
LRDGAWRDPEQLCQGGSVARQFDCLLRLHSGVILAHLNT